MDGRSHLIFGKKVLEKCGLDTAYTDWSTAPDIDLSFFHRYWRHRFSVLNKIYEEFLRLEPTVPVKDKEAIVVAITSHFWLDIYNSWIWVWGFLPRFPALFVPKEVKKEYIEDLSIGLLAGEPEEAIKEFFEESEKLFETFIPVLTVDETLSWMLTSLKKHTYLGDSNVKAAVKSISRFMGREIKYKDLNVKAEEKYYNFLDDFFAKW
ncbi:hypothetical protein DRN97_08445 [Methanosarcinales archaeon]|nr:MAG: hypothetical protein DRN97_08445 [Methanosarcinales archaeon]